MAISAGQLNCRYMLQAPTLGTDSGDGARPLAWSDEQAFWGSRESDGFSNEYTSAGSQHGMAVERVTMRNIPGVTASKRLLRMRDQTTLSAGVNSSVTTIPISAALRFEGTAYDYFKVDSEIMRVASGGSTTSLTVERGVLGTTAASHSSGAVARRVEPLEILAVDYSMSRQGEITLRVCRNE
jgi:head-tail adaptor